MNHKHIRIMVVASVLLLLCGCDSKDHTLLNGSSHVSLEPGTAAATEPAASTDPVNPTTSEVLDPISTAISTANLEEYAGLTNYEPSFKLENFPEIYHSKYAVFRTASGSMTKEELVQAGKEVNTVIENLQDYLGVTLEDSWGKYITYFVRSGELQRVTGSYSMPVVFLSPSEGRIPMYAHETTHLLAGCKNVNSTWLVEGLAVYLNEKFSAYPTWPQYNTDLDTVAKKEYENYADVITFEQETGYTFHNPTENKGKAYYVLSGSFVKYLDSQIGIELLMKVYKNASADTGLQKETGKSLTEWKAEWISYLTASIEDTNQRTTTPYPRLGMWWLDAYTASAEEMARYDLLLQGFDEDDSLEEKYKELTAMNPDQINLKPLSPSERQLFMEDWETGGLYPNPEIKDLPTCFFLLQTGARLLEETDETTTVLKLDRLEDEDGQPLFIEGAEIAIGEYESAKVIAINWENNEIEVERGYVRAATMHQAGEQAATHICFWPGSWVMNVTEACPTVSIDGLKEQVNWIGYYFNLISGNLNSIYRHTTDNYDLISNDQGYEGFVIDRFEDKESWLRWVNDEFEIQLDLYQDFSIVSEEEFDASWIKGTDQLQALLEEAFPRAVIIRNNPITERYEPYDGQVYESGGWSEPTQEWWEQMILTADTDEYYKDMPYLNWFKGKWDSNLVLFEVYEDESSPDNYSDGVYVNPFLEEDFIPNYQRMRFSLTTALLGDGYYSYEINTNGHGSLGLMWFDEYDNAGEGKGYLGYPLDQPVKFSSGAYARYFEHGMVLVNPTEEDVTVELSKPYQKINGIQDTKVNNGEVVEQVMVGAYDGIILLKIID